jgi:hypothetical protein
MVMQTLTAVDDLARLLPKYEWRYFTITHLFFSDDFTLKMLYWNA